MFVPFRRTPAAARQLSIVATFGAESDGLGSCSIDIESKRGVSDSEYMRVLAGVAANKIAQLPLHIHAAVLCSFGEMVVEALERAKAGREASL